MDINMPDMDGITATGEMATRAPFSQVIIMSVQADQHYMKRAMAAGARDFQPKPFTSQELVACIRRVYNIGMPVYKQFEALETSNALESQAVDEPDQIVSDSAPVIAVYSPKGGTGASAIATNFAVALHQAQSDVVLVDGSLQFGDVSVHLNTRVNTSVVDMIHDGKIEIDLIDDVLLAHSSGLKLLMAPPQPELAEAITGPMIPEVFTALKEKFRGIVADTASQLTDTTLAILEAPDCILVILTPELTAIKSAKLFLELTQKLDFGNKHVLVVINRADVPGGVKPHQIQKVLKLEQTYQIPIDARLVEALIKGTPVVLTDPTAPSATAIRSLASAVLERLAIPVSQRDNAV
jgi:pilus assembly protein CpaE